jgi:hypothetical protein
MSQIKTKTRFPWSLIITGCTIPIVGILANFFYPELRCSLGLFVDTCPKSLQQVELITQSDAGEPLAGVKVQVIGKGAPENQYTDSNGYAKVQISNKGDVRVNLSASGYPVQDFNINLLNDQNTARIIRFTKSGKPEVSSVPSILKVASSSAPPPIPSPARSTVAPYEDDRIRASALGASFDQSQVANASIIIENKSAKDLLLAVEYRGVRMISDAGGATECGLDGLTSINGLPDKPNPLSFSTLRPNAKATLSVSNCQKLDSSKTNTVSVNIPLVLLQNDHFSKFTIDLSGIPIQK